MKSSFHPAFFSLPRIEIFEASLLARLSAMRRRRPRFSGPLPLRLRIASSFIVTSSTQCSAFSIDQCALVAARNFSALMALLRR